MSRILFAAPASGSGKTGVTCAFLRAAQRRGLRPAAFKCGPDYIDPMFHRQVLGVPSHNLDLFLSDRETVRSLLCGHSGSPDVLEGVMGYYDGVGGTTDRASAWDLANATDTPVVLVVTPGGSALTLAAQIKGLLSFRSPHRVAALLLNRCSPMLAKTLAPLLERETGLPVAGALPELPEAALQSRHLGLVTAAEVPDLQARVDLMADALEQYADVELLLRIADSAPTLAAEPLPERQSPRTRIAVARDEAFCFCYPDNLDLLERMGGQPVFFSPLRSAALPRGVGGLYLPGGYPELYTEALAENAPLRAEIARAVGNGLPTVAECGGFLYLQQSLQDPSGTACPMCGVLEGEGFPTGRLQRFGYAQLQAQTDNLLLRAGEMLPVHSFHYWDSTANGADLLAQKPVSGRSWRCGVTGPALFAGFAHLYFYARPALAQRFVEAAAGFGPKEGPLNDIEPTACGDCPAG